MLLAENALVSRGLLLRPLALKYSFPTWGRRNGLPEPWTMDNMFLDSKQEIKIKTAAGGQETWKQEGKTNYMTFT